MSELHICTNESLRAGMEDFPPSECNLCEHETMFVDWCGMMCHTCGADVEMGFQSSIVVARNRLYISRRQFAELTGYKYSTIKKYDFCGGSKPYYDKAKEVIKKLYSDSSLVAKCKAESKRKTHMQIKKILADLQEK